MSDTIQVLADIQCGCQAIYLRDDPAWRFCPVHAAMPEVTALLVQLVGQLEGDAHVSPEARRLVERAREVLETIETELRAIDEADGGAA